MDKCIIYKNANGNIAVLHLIEAARKKILEKAAIYEDVTISAVMDDSTDPPTEMMPEHTEQQLVSEAVYRDETDDEFLAWVAAKDVPSGLPFKVINIADLPDRDNRELWDVDDTLLTDGVGADYGEGSVNDVTGWNEDGAPVVGETS